MTTLVSRRDFCRIAAGYVALQWGGMRIIAGSDGRSLQGSHPAAQPFIYGTAFYRPPNPPASERQGMLRAIAEQYKFNIIRIYPAWTYYNPAPDHFEFDDVDEVMQYCDEFGLRVLMGVVIEEAPYWLEKQHPETRYVDARGNFQRLSDSGNNVSGGWPGLCLDWEPVQNAAKSFIRELARMAASHRSMYAYDCWNEPHIEPCFPRNIWAQPQEFLYCYCEKTIENFRHWLNQRYGSLDALNHAWVRRYSAWSEIDPPRAMGTYLDWIDWRNYIIERSTWEMKFRVGAIRAADADHIFESHGAHHPPIDGVAIGGTNGWSLAEVVQNWGLSNFPRWGSFPVHIGAAKVEITRSNAAGKPFWMTELQGGHGSSGLYESPHMRPRDIRLWNWLAVAGGAKGIIYWTYHSEATGSEATGFGLVNRDGSQTDRVLEASKDCQLIEANWDLLKSYQPKPEIAILTDQDNGILTYAMAGSEDASTQSFRGYYKALWQLDYWTDFIEPSGLDNVPYKVVIVPWHLIGKKNTCEKLRQYAERGGCLILETAFGMFDEQCFYNPVVPPYGLSAAFGYRELEPFYLQPKGERNPLADILGPAVRPQAEQIYDQPEIRFSDPAAVPLKAHTFVTPIQINSATPIGVCQSYTVAAKKQVGKGQIFYVGTNLGASITTGDNGGIELLRAMLTPIVRPKVTAKALRPRFIEGTSRSLLVIFNDTSRDETETIALPRPYARATDIHSKKQLSLENQLLQVTVPYEDAVVVQLDV